MSKTRPILLALVAMTMTSCSAMALRKHEPHFKNTRSLKAAQGIYHIETIDAQSPEMEKLLKGNSFGCRGAFINLPAQNKNVSEFLKSALKDEFDAAEKLSDNGQAISLTVNDLDSHNASIEKGYWSIDFDYLVRGEKINVKTKTEYESAYMGDTACRNAGNALTDALSENFSGFYKRLSK